MKVLMFSLDRKVLESDSPVAKRIVALSEAAAGPHFSSHLRKEGEGITVLVPGRGHKVWEFFKLWRRGEKLLSHASAIPLSAPFLSRGGEGKPFDLITVQDTGYVALLAYLLARRHKVPFEVQVHGLEKFRGLRKRIAAFVVKKAGGIRVVGARLRQQLATDYQLPTAKIYELSVYPQIEPPRGVHERPAPHPFTFLTVGRLVPVKNTALQIRALAELARDIPHARLVIVGDGAERSNLQRAARDFRLGGRVAFAGAQKEVSRFYEEADAFLLTSDYEGWGLAAVEAAAYHLPIVMTDVGLAGEFIKNGENGLVVPAGDAGALARAMELLIRDAALRRQLGEAAYRSFRALPSAEEQIQRQVRTWRSLAGLSEQ